MYWQGSKQLQQNASTVAIRENVKKSLALTYFHISVDCEIKLLLNLEMRFQA